VLIYYKSDSLLKNVYQFSRSRIFSTLKMETTRSSETSVLTRSTWRHILGGGILQFPSTDLLDHQCVFFSTLSVLSAATVLCYIAPAATVISESLEIAREEAVLV
jgi:hypothetical protein